MASRNQQPPTPRGRCYFGGAAAATVATAVVLALGASSAQASANVIPPPSSSASSSCVRVTDAAFSPSSCVPGAHEASFVFSMEGVTTTRRLPAIAGVEASTGETKAERTTSYATTQQIGESSVPCPATGVTITVGFGAPITSAAYPGAIVSPGGNTITFPVETLESNPTHFSLILDTTDVPSGASVVSHVTYADSQGNSPDLSSLMAVSSALECDEGAAGTAVAGEDAVAAAAGSTAGEDVAVIVSFSRRIQEEKEEEEFDCSTCEDLTDAQVEALAAYDNGGKQIVCDPTCLDGVSDPTHCNYFGLGQICRGCGECSTCEPCPVPSSTPPPAPESTDAPVSASTPTGTPSPDSVPAPTPTTTGTPSPTSVSAPTRDTPSPTSVSAPTRDTPSPISEPAPTRAGTPSSTVAPVPAPTGTPAPTSVPAPTFTGTPSPTAVPVAVGTPSPVATIASTDDDADDDGGGGGDDDDEDSAFDCSPCEDLTDAQVEALAAYDNGGKQIVCDPTCLDGVSDPTHCNYFGLGQICRGCGECSSCEACPVPSGTPAPAPGTTDAPAGVPTPADGTPSPTSVSASAPTETPSPNSSSVPAPTPTADSTSSPVTTSTSTEDDAAPTGTPSPNSVPAPAPTGDSTPSPVMTSTEDDDSDDASSAQTPSPTLAPVMASTPSPVVTGTSTDDDATSTGTPSPTTATSPQDNDDTDGNDDGDNSEFDCSACDDLTDAQIEALAKYDDDGGKAIVCDPTCLDGVSDPLHCNYFGLGQICRGTGE